MSLLSERKFDTSIISTRILYATVAILYFFVSLIISYKLWVNGLRFGNQPLNFIPDGHGEFAMMWHQVISNPSNYSWNKLVQWSTGYYQASNWLTAFLAGFAMVFSGSIRYYSTLYAFFLVNGLASGVTAYFLYRYLKEFIRLREHYCLIMLILFWSHIAILPSLLKPMTDALLLAFLTTSLYFVTKLFLNKDTSLLAIPIVIIFSFGIMVKLSFAPILFVPLSAWIFLRCFNKNSFELSISIPFWGVAFISIPLLFWLIYMSGLNLFPTLSMQAETLKRFGYSYNPEWFLITLMVVGQGYLGFLSGVTKRERLVDPVYLIPLVWSIGYLVLIIIAGIPFWHRHFLPIIPVLFILSAKNIEKYMESKRFWWGLPLFFLLLNYLIIFRFLTVSKWNPVLTFFN